MIKALLKWPIVLAFLTCFVSFDYDQKSETAPLDFRVRKPVIASKNPPVLILLHGLGSNEQDMFSLADQFGDQWLIFSVRAPFTVSKDRYKWASVNFSSGEPVTNIGEAEKSKRRIIDFINWVYKNYPIDTKRVYLIGFSQGAMMGYGIALNHPELMRGAALMSGKLLKEFRPAVLKDKKLTNLSLFISHGTDDIVIKIWNARESVAYLKSIGLHPEYHEYAAPHGITPEMMHDLTDWLNGR